MEFINVKLSDIGEVVGGATPSTKNPDNYDGNIAWITPKDLAGYNTVYISKGERNITEMGFKSCSTKILPKNSVLFSSRAPIGYVAISENDLCTNQGFKSIIPNNKIDYKFLYYLLKHNKNYIASKGSGSTFKEVSGSVMKGIELSIPKNIHDQKKISKILFDIDKKIELNNEINNNLQELINNIFISKFVNYYGYTGEYETTEIGDIPSNWKVDNLGNVISFSNGYGWNANEMLENNQPDTYKVFKMGNIKIGGGINKEKTRSWILKEKCSGLEQFLSKKGDILMCMTDMKSSENPLLGHTALIDCDDEFVINQRVGIIRCDKDIRWPYIYTMTNLPFFINNIRSKAHSGVQVNLTTSGICDTKVLIPDKDSLEEFYKNVTPMYEEMFILNNEIEKLEQLRDTLLPKLMNGEIDLDNIEI